MGEQRKNDLVIMLKKPGKDSVKLELFSAKKFGQKENLYRLRSNGTWVGKRGKGEAYSFFELQEIMDILKQNLIDSYGL